jgi:hypothetical protein
MQQTTTSGTATSTWPELAEGIYGFLTGRGASIEYTFREMAIGVPSSTDADAPRATWHLSGTLAIRTTER